MRVLSFSGADRAGPDGQALAAATAFCAASASVSAVIIFASARMARPSSSFVPTRRTTIGTCVGTSFKRLEDAARHFVAAGDAAKDVEQHRLDVRVGEDDAQRGGDLVGLGAAADVEEVGRLAAVVA